MHTLGQPTIRDKYKPFNCKLVRSGDTTEIYQYENLQFKKLKSDTIKVHLTKPEKGKNKNIEDESYKRKPRTIYRTIRNMRRLIDANVNQYKEQDKFITLTFEIFCKRDEVLAKFKLFNRRLKLKYPNIDYQYIAVIERGTNGTQRLHLHCLFFGLPYIPFDEFKELWTYGGVQLNSIKNTRNMSQYVLKYVGKTIEDGSYIPKGAKFYITSQGLKKPIEDYISNGELVYHMNTIENSSVKVHSHHYNLDYIGGVDYSKYKAKRGENHGSIQR